MAPVVLVQLYWKLYCTTTVPLKERGTYIVVCLIWAAMVETTGRHETTGICTEGLVCHVLYYSICEIRTRVLLLYYL
jgi:hypothetical protein